MLEIFKSFEHWKLVGLKPAYWSFYVVHYKLFPQYFGFPSFSFTSYPCYIVVCATYLIDLSISLFRWAIHLFSCQSAIGFWHRLFLPSFCYSAPYVFRPPNFLSFEIWLFQLRCAFRNQCHLVYQRRTIPFVRFLKRFHFLSSAVHSSGSLDCSIQPRQKRPNWVRSISFSDNMLWTSAKIRFKSQQKWDQTR